MLIHLRLARLQIAAAALLGLATAARADFVVSNPTQAAFAAATFGSTDTFGNLSIGPDAIGASLNRSAGAIDYTVSTANNFYVGTRAGSGGPILAVEQNTDSITFGSFLSGTRAFGAYLWLTDAQSSSVTGSVTITATDINGLTRTTTLAQTFGGNSNNSTTTPIFYGVTSDFNLLSISVSSTLPTVNASQSFVSADSITLSPVPEPSSILLMLAGGAFMLSRVARRRG